MVVLTVNYNEPDEQGNVNIQMSEGPLGDQGIQGQREISNNDQVKFELHL